MSRLRAGLGSLAVLVICGYSVHTYLLDGASDPVYGLQFYPQDVIREQLVVEAATAVQAQMPIPDARFAFVPTGSQQTTATVSDELAALDIAVLPIDQILGAIKYLPLNTGEAWGHLRIFPPDNDDLSATDIPVFDELPLDLSVVAGVLTRAVQDTNSHVNLKSKERNTPNAVLRDASLDHPRLAAFNNQPVHLVVAKDDFLIEPTTEEIIAAKLAERMDRPLVELEWEPETELRSYDEMAVGTAREARRFNARYGSKAANLGFLAHRDVLGRVTDQGSPGAASFPPGGVYASLWNKRAVEGAPSPGSTSAPSPWAWPSCPRTTPSPRWRPTRWWSPRC